MTRLLSLFLIVALAAYALSAAVKTAQEVGEKMEQRAEHRAEQIRDL